MSLPLLQSSLRFRIRFSEIDAMRVVWHGAYAKYFEDAREQFGKDYGLDYLLIERRLLCPHRGFVVSVPATAPVWHGA